MIRNCINGRDLDLSKEVFWVSVDQRTAKLQAVKFGGQKVVDVTLFHQIACAKCSAAFRLTETQSISLKRSKLHKTILQKLVENHLSIAYFSHK